MNSTMTVNLNDQNVGLEGNITNGHICDPDVSKLVSINITIIIFISTAIQ